MKYKYQMHTHTSPTSKCARMTPRELCEALHKAGYSGCVLTNHFFHGNTGISRDLPWDEFVAAYERDYLECKREGERYGLDILFGIEEGVEGHREILLYGLTPEMLYAHPELIMTSGVDTHSANTVGAFGIITEKRLKTAEELVDVLRSGEYDIVRD